MTFFQVGASFTDPVFVTEIHISFTAKRTIGRLAYANWTRSFPLLIQPQFGTLTLHDEGRPLTKVWLSMALKYGMLEVGPSWNLLFFFK